MTWKLTEAYLNIKNNREAGQGALEYIGILAIVLLVMGTAYTAFSGKAEAISTSIGTTITGLLGGGAAGKP